MADLEKLVVQLQLETGQMQQKLVAMEKDLKSFGNTATDQGKKIASAGETIKKSFTFAGLAIGLEQMVGKLKEFTKIAGEDAKGAALLTRQIKETTHATTEQATAVDEQLRSMSLMSGVTMEQMRPAYTLLLRSTKDTTKALELQKLALDVSAGTGRNLTMVTMALSRSMNGSQVALNRLAPEIKNVTDKMGYLKTTFKGAAETAANADPYMRLDNAIHEIQVQIGTQLLPIISAFSKWLVDNTPLIMKLTTAFTNMMPIIGGLAAGFLTYKIATMGVSAAMTVYEGVVALATIATEGFTIALASTGIGAIAIAVGLLVAGILGLNQAMGQSPDDTANLKRHAQAVEYATQKMKDFYAAEKGMTNDQKAAHRTNVDGTGRNIAAQYQYWISSKQAELKAADDAAQAAKDANLKAAQDQAKADAQNAANQSQMNSAAAPLVKYLGEVQNQVTKAVDAYHKQVDTLTSDFQKKITDRITSFKDAFQKATAFNLTDMWNAGANSGQALIDGLKSKLQSMTSLTQNVAKLAGAGFSSDFIQQIVDAGPAIGGQMADAILQSTPDAQKQLQDLFSQATDMGQHGVDFMGTSIAGEFKAAADQLATAITNATGVLNTTLLQLTGGMTTTINSSSALAKAGASGDITKTTALLKSGKVTTTTAGVQKSVNDYASQAVANAGVAPTINVTMNINGVPTPMQVANDLSSAIKYGITQGVNP